MKIKEATIVLGCAYEDCKEELVIDIGDVFDFSMLEARVRNEVIHEGWKLYSREEIPFCSNQHLLNARN